MNIEILSNDKTFDQVEVGEFFIEPGTKVSVMKVSHNSGIRYLAKGGDKVLWQYMQHTPVIIPEKVEVVITK